jgi:hypothetical protein
MVAYDYNPTIPSTQDAEDQDSNPARAKLVGDLIGKIN